MSLAHPLHHHVERVRLDALHPTQMTVGRDEVDRKREQWRALPARQRARRLRDHLFPAVTGPGGRPYVIDHHHLGLALLEEDAGTVWIQRIADWERLDGESFWRTMEFRGWAHPYGPRGERRAYRRIPARLDGLRDDPYRGLAARVRDAGGYAKSDLPFAEFQWADFYRPCFERRTLLGFEPSLVARAIALAVGDGASHLPGWSGRHARDEGPSGGSR